MPDMETRMSDEKQKAHEAPAPLEATALPEEVEACDKAHQYIASDDSAAHEAISAIVAAAKGEKP
jgi:hypothetical protein